MRDNGSLAWMQRMLRPGEPRTMFEGAPRGCAIGWAPPCGRLFAKFMIEAHAQLGSEITGE